MAAIVTFQALLLRLQFTQEQAAAIITEGISSPEDLRTYRHSDLKDFFKHLSTNHVVTRFGSQHKMQILWYWVERRSHLGLPTDSVLFTNAVLAEWGQKMKSDALVKSDKEDSLVQDCKPFKKDAKWRVWQEQFKTMLSSKKGKSSIRLVYVIHLNDEPAADNGYMDE